MTDEQALIKIKELCGYGEGFRPENEYLVQTVSQMVFMNIQLDNILRELDEIVYRPEKLDLDAVYDAEGNVVGKLPGKRYARGVGDKILGTLKET